jgi:hypothetical protein
MPTPSKKQPVSTLVTPTVAVTPETSVADAQSKKKKSGKSVLIKFASFGKSKTKGGKKTIKLISIKKSTNKGKKLMATFETNGRRKVIHFGAAGMRDFTIMGHDRKRMMLYRKRHTKDLKTGNPTRAGFLSMFILWNKPSLQASISDYRRRLGVYNRTGKFPTKF